MESSFKKDVLLWFIIPLVVITLIVFLSSSLNKKDNLKQDISVYKNTVSVIPKINWLVDWADQPVKRDFIKEFASEYMFSNQDIKINLMFSDYSIKTRQALQIVNMIKTNIYNWDIVWIDESVYKVVAQELDNEAWGKEYLVDFQKVEGYSTTHLSEIMKNPAYRAKTGNSMIGPYLDGFYGVLWYNKKVSDILDIEVKKTEMTFDDLLTYAKKISQYNLSAGDNKIALFSESTEFTLSYLFQNSVWGELEKSGYKTPPPPDVSKQILLKTLTLFEKLSEYEPLIESNMINLWFDAKQALINNQSLFLVGKTSLYNEIFDTDSAGFINILPAEFPSNNFSKCYFGSFQPAFAVMNYAPNREAAVQIIKNLSESPYAEKWIKKTKNPSGIACNVNENFIDNDPYNNFLVYIAQKYNYNVRYSMDAGYILGKSNAGLFYLIDENARLVLTGEITAQEALENITNNLSD